MKILRYDDYPVVPWKNGQGVTRDILRTPNMGDAFLWGLSLADLEQPSTFSAFDGYDRTITLIDGDGFTLSFEDGHVQTLDSAFAPYDFDGGAPLQCALIGGKSRVFNLKVRREAALASWRVLDLKDRAAIHPKPNADQVLFCLCGNATLESTTGGQDTLGKWDCAAAGEQDALTLRAGTGVETKILHAMITRRSSTA